MDEINEIWKDISGYEGLYQVSNLGKVKSLKFNKILKCHTQHNILMVNLKKDSKNRLFNLPKLVASAFLPNINNYYYLRYKDNDYTNCRVDNLVWKSKKIPPTQLEKARRVILCRQLGIISFTANEMVAKLKNEGYPLATHQGISDCFRGICDYHMEFSFVDIKNELLEGISIEELVEKYRADMKSDVPKNVKIIEGKRIRYENCTIEGCNNKHMGLGLCAKHYARFKKYGDPLFLKWNQYDKYCSIEGCDRENYALGYCSKHYALLGKVCKIKPEKKKKEKVIKPKPIKEKIEVKDTPVKKKMLIYDEERFCVISGCTDKRVVKKNGEYYCLLHCERIFNCGDPYGELEGGLNPNNRICLVEGCNGKSLTNGYCLQHYKVIDR